LPRQLQIPKDCNYGVIVGEVDGYGGIDASLKRPGARWDGGRPNP
jgi:hypothetical protein